MKLRGASFLAGLALLGATAHATIAATGGYGSAHSYVTVAIAGGVCISALAVGSAWGDRPWLAAWLVAAIAAGEAFGFLGTAERLVTAREVAQVPLQVAADAYAKALRRVSEAAAALARAPASSPRLAAAIAEKAAADNAASEKSAERGCRDNCRQLLQARVDAAEREVAAARAALAAGETATKAELDAARASLADMTAPASATPLADRVGMPAWALDLLTAALGSVAANGLACGLISFAGHGRRREESPHAGAAAPPPLPAPSHAEVPATDTLDCVRRFAFDCLFPAAPDAALNVAEIRAAFRRWCAQRQIEPPAGPDLGRAMGELFKRVGIALEQREGSLVALGVSLQGEQVALPKPGTTIGERLGKIRDRKQSA